MKKAIILHGTCNKEEYYSEEYPSLSNSHWIPWLQKQLLIQGMKATTPEMFEAYKPDYQSWKEEFEKEKIDDRTILIGHSCGGGFLIRWLSENPDIKVDTLILIAPWLDPFRQKGTDFFDFQIDANLMSRCKKAIIYNSTNDKEDIKESLQIIKSTVKNINIKNFENYGHFCYRDMGTQKFPEILEFIKE